MAPNGFLARVDRRVVASLALAAALAYWVSNLGTAPARGAGVVAIGLLLASRVTRDDRRFVLQHAMLVALGVMVSFADPVALGGGLRTALRDASALGVLFVALGVVGVAVELYNRQHGTAHLRFS